MEIIIIYKAIHYLRFITAEMTKILLVSAVCYGICEWLALHPSIWGIAVKILVCLAISISIPALLSFHTKEFHETITLIKKLKSKKI